MGNYISWLIDMGSKYLLGTAPKPIKPKLLSSSRLDKLAQISGLTKAEVKEWHDGFIKDCPTRKLNKKKFIEVYKQFFPAAKAEKFSEYVFKTFDTDGSGEVDFDEFLIAISLTAKRDPKQKLEWAFSMYDIDNSGYVEQKEMIKIMEAIYDLNGEDKHGANPPAKTVERIFTKMDKNQDYKLSSEEFVNGCLMDEHLNHLLSPSMAS